MYKYTLTPPPPPLPSPPLPHLNPHCTHHSTSPSVFLRGSFPSFRESAHSIPFHYQSVRAKHSLPFGLRACTYIRCLAAAHRPVISEKCMYIKWSLLGIQSSSFNNIREPRHIAILLQIPGQLGSADANLVLTTGQDQQENRNSKIKSNSTLSHTPRRHSSCCPYIKSSNHLT